MRIRRTVPPVGYRVRTADLLAAAASWKSGGLQREILETGFARHFAMSHVCAVSSGKAALTLALRALHTVTGRRKVIIPAYTCYSVPSAIVNAGLEVVACDVASESFDYDYSKLVSKLDADVLCVVSVHLFGIRSDTARVKALCDGRGIFVLEDAAQALSAADIGAAADAVVFSFGRGKNLTCGSGGVVLARSTAIGAALTATTANVPAASSLDAGRTLLMLMLLSWFISPNRYWLPAGLPFLRLGETVFHERFPISRLSDFQARLLHDWSDQVARLDRTRIGNAAYYLKHISGARPHGVDVPYLRFPVVLPRPIDKDRLLRDLDARALGITSMYPTSVAEIPQLRETLAEGDFPEADRLARSLITLPTHPLVRRDDLARIAAAVNTVIANNSEVALQTRETMRNASVRL
jgi:perosamine synthetase